MGEVYRARDTRLERTVAIKVLPSHLSKNDEIRQRFEREAKTISQLSHPHICALYDVGNQDGTEYLVMELLEGETLQERLRKGPLPLQQMLRFGIEIADALDKAHRQGIVHRDLKPGNVMLTKSGVKLLDFGLAKALPSSANGEGLTALPTQAGNLTEAGTILGTFQYMSPEQLEGKEADARTDIFAFGCVLYEMATGRKAFSGTSQASLISAIMTAEPAPIALGSPMTPPALDRVVKTCLAKDPEDRFQTAHDARLQLQWIAEGGSLVGIPAPVVARRMSREKMAWGFAAAFFVAVILLGISYVRRAPEPPRILRASLDLPANTRLDPNAPLALSPDGRRLAIAAFGEDEKLRLWVRPLDSLSAQPLAGTEGATYPFWSPDSRFIGFFADSKLKKVEASGGSVQTICQAPAGRGADWNPDGTIVFAPEVYGGLALVASGGGSSTPLEADPGAGTSHRLPHFLPDGRHLLFYSQGAKEPGVYAFDLQTRKAQLLFRSESEARYVEPGYLAFLRERNLMVQRFDARTLRTIGEARPIAEGVQFTPSRCTGAFSLAGTRLLVFQAGVGEVSQLTWLDLDGKRVGTVGEAVRFLHEIPPFSISPDGRRIVAAIQGSEAGTDLWMIDAARGVRTRFTFGAGSRGFGSPVWSPDGRQVAYSISEAGGMHLALKDANGTAGEQELFSNGDSLGPVSWSPDGQTLAFRTQSSQTKSFDIWLLSVADRKARPFLASRANEFSGRFSPDGHWFGYLSDESGKAELYVVPYPGPGGKWQISSGGIEGAFGDYAWLSSSELAYRSEKNKWYAVTLTPRAQALEIGPPRAILGETPTGNWADYSLAMKRFLVDVPIHEERSAPVFLVTNWAAGLQDR